MSYSTNTTLTFEFIGNSGLDQYRDSSGRVSIAYYYEFYRSDGTVEISSWSVFDVRSDNKYSVELIDGDNRDIYSITFYVFGYEDEFSLTIGL
jgi:hypothetical protein